VLNGLTTIEGLVIPSGIFSLQLDSLSATKNLIIPEGVTRLSLGGITTAEGLVIPESVQFQVTSVPKEEMEKLGR